MSAKKLQEELFELIPPRWTVLPAELPEEGMWKHSVNGKSARVKIQVKLLYNQKVVAKSTGRIFWENCKELAARYNRSGYQPIIPTTKVLADYKNHEARGEAAKKGDPLR